MDLSKRYELHASTYTKDDKADSSADKIKVNVDNVASRKRKFEKESGADARESAPTVVDPISCVKKEIGADACECAQTVVSSFANEPPQSLPYYDQAEVDEFLARRFY